MHRRPRPRRPAPRLTLLASCLATLFPAATAVHAAEAVLEPIVVTGQAARLKNALDKQQAEDTIVSILHADGIGSLPDTNAAEALQRVPGVSVERDQGEGRYVRVRGLGPDLNSVTINGSLVPAPESDRRAVMLDVIPTSLVRALEVKKTLTPDQDANSLGGTVEIKTLSGFDYNRRFISLESEAGRNLLTGRTSPKLAATFADRLADGRLGIAAGLSWEKRKFGSDNVETGGAWRFGANNGAQLDTFQRRDYQISRERLGGVVNLDYKPGAGEHYYLRTLFSRFDDTEERQAHQLTFDGSRAPDAVGKASSSRLVKLREETQHIRSLSVGGERRWGDWQLKLAAGASGASEKEPTYLSSAEFAGNSSFAGVGFRDGRRPALTGPDSLYDPAQFALKKAKLVRTDAEDEERHVRVDLARDFSLGEHDLKLQAGGKLSRREKAADEDAWQFKSLNKPPAPLSAAQLGLVNFLQGQVDWSLGRFGPRIDAHAVNALLGRLNRDAYVDAEGSRVNDFQVQEDIDAGYLQASLDHGPWKLLTGVRYEATRQHARGTGLEDGRLVATDFRNRYRHWLPALHVRYDFDRDTSLRAALTKAVVRPTFGQMAPGFSINDDEASFGNPDLQPLQSRNFDLGLERRLGPAATASVYLFDKDLRHFIYHTDLAGTGRWRDFAAADTYANGDHAKVRGIELNFSQQFQSLPAPWNGLLFAVNATLLHSEATIRRFDTAAGSERSRNIPLPSASHRTANLMLGYEAGPWSLRIAANYKSRYLLEVPDVLDSRRDLYVDAQTQIDFSARYALNKQVQLVFEASNLGNEPYYVYTGEARYNAQFETYGRTYKLGVRVALD